MLFYKVTAALTDEQWAKENNDRDVLQERKRLINAQSDRVNQRDARSGCRFVSRIDRDGILCGMFTVRLLDPVAYASRFFKEIGVEVKDVKAEEITFTSARTLLSLSFHNDYIENTDELMERYGLDRIYSMARRTGFTEYLLDPAADRKPLYDTSERLLCRDTLTPELDRIYAGDPKAKAFGHPVHYFVEADDDETGETLCRTLLQALHSRGRIRSRRYCSLDLTMDEDFSEAAVDSVYKSCPEGAVVLNCLTRDDEESDVCSVRAADMTEFLCQTLRKYRHQVLTLICLPRACEKTKEAFFESLGTVSMVEIREDLADRNRAGEYLKLLCREQHVRADKKLLLRLTKEAYYPDELRDLFEEWYDVKMKTALFPQYKEVRSCRTETAEKPTRGSAYGELQEMIGLREAKTVIGRALNYYKLQRMYKDKGVRQDRPAMHMVFTGNPGTAKTTAARLFARIMRENGLLSKGHLVEVGRSDLVGKYVGWTAQIVRAKFKAAMGGVLFIDEAYSLADDRGGSYGDEAINTIVQEMENRREDLVVIFAGYPAEMETFLQKNPGLRSRIAFHVPFADYSAEELCSIARLMGKKKGITFTNGAAEKLERIFECARKSPDFGNGRYVRNLLEQARMNLAERVMAMDPETVTEKTLSLVEEEDIRLPVGEAAPFKRTIGFASC